MNILFLSTRSPYPLVSGHTLRTYHILEGAARKHNVILVTFVQVPDLELKEENLEHLRGLCHAVYLFEIPVDVSRYKFVSSLFLNLFSKWPFVARKYDVLAFREKIREIIIKENIDLVHVDMLPLTVYVNEFEHIPRILVNHNVESVRLHRWVQTESNFLKKVYLGIQWLKLKSFEIAAINKYNSCVAVSEQDKKILKDMGACDSLSVVPNGTDTTFFKPSGVKTKKKSVLWFGHMDVHTNKDAVLYFWRKMYPLLRRQYPEVEVSFVGTAPPKEIADAAKRNSHVVVTGFVDDIRPYVDEAAVVVIPMRIGSGTRVKILDAMAMGKAIVSTSVGCEGLKVADGENILIADEPEDFVRKIILILTNDRLLQKISESALNLAKEYDWEHIYKIQEQVYQDALVGHIKF
jgi:glycosyltransferase involved in cell wall biosynthesis